MAVNCETPGHTSGGTLRRFSPCIPQLMVVRYFIPFKALLGNIYDLRDDEGTFTDDSCWDIAQQIGFEQVKPVRNRLRIWQFRTAKVQAKRS